MAKALQELGLMVLLTFLLGTLLVMCDMSLRDASKAFLQCPPCECNDQKSD